MADRFEDCEVELYDWELAGVEKIHRELNERFPWWKMLERPTNGLGYEGQGITKRASKMQDEFKMVAQAEFFSRMGLIVSVDLLDFNLGQGPPYITIQKRISGHADNKYGIDHEFKK